MRALMMTLHVVAAFTSATAAYAEPPLLRIALEDEPSSLDWHAYRSDTERLIVSFLMRGLLKYNPHGKPVCDLCHAYSTSPDQRVLYFELDPEAKWSDGVAVEASHFVDGFRRLLDPSRKHRIASEFDAIEGAVQTDAKWDPAKLGVSAISPSKLQIVLGQPTADFEHLLTMTAAFPIRLDVIAAAEKAREPVGEAMARAVTGPYLLGEWDHSRRLVIEANPALPLHRPVFRVEFVFGPRGELLKRFADAKVDIIANPSTEEAVRFEGARVQVSPYWATRSLIFNVRVAPYSDANLRRAVLHSLDRDLLPTIVRTGERPVTGLIPPGITGYRSVPLAAPDPARAQGMRHRAVAWPGWVEGRLLIRDNSSERAFAGWLTDRLEAIHLRIRTVALKGEDHFRALEGGDFEMALVTWQFKSGSPLDLLKTFSGESPMNLSGWRNAEFDRGLRELAGETRDKVYSERIEDLAELIENQEAAAIPLGYPTQAFLVGRRVASFALTPFGDPDLLKIEVK